MSIKTQIFQIILKLFAQASITQTVKGTVHTKIKFAYFSFSL